MIIVGKVRGEIRKHFKCFISTQALEENGYT